MKAIFENAMREQLEDQQACFGLGKDLYEYFS